MRVLTVCSVLCFVCRAYAGTIVVGPQWNPYKFSVGVFTDATHNDGVAPTPVAVPVSAVSVTFAATGDVTCSAGDPAGPVGPDGGPGCGSFTTDVTSGGGGIAGIKAPAGMFLAGVFLNSDPSAPAPPDLDYSAPGAMTAPTFSPLLNQLFFIGDGSTGSSQQVFFVPATATRLILGYADAFDGTTAFHGSPGFYFDNASTTGGMTVDYTFAVAGVPEPGTAAGFVVAIAVLYGMRRRRR